MRIFAFVFIYALSSPLFAADLSHNLLRARSSAEIDRIQSDFTQLRVAKDACRIQMRDHRTPSACYESLFLEIKRGRYALPENRRRLLARLDEICEEAASRLQSTSDDRFLSIRCRKSMARAREIRKYREHRIHWPEN